MVSNLCYACNYACLCKPHVHAHTNKGRLNVVTDTSSFTLCQAHASRQAQQHATRTHARAVTRSGQKRTAGRHHVPASAGAASANCLGTKQRIPNEQQIEILDPYALDPEPHTMFSHLADGVDASALSPAAAVIA